MLEQIEEEQEEAKVVIPEDQTEEVKEGEEAPKEGEETEEEESEQYITKEADKLHGEDIEVELPEGVDPDSAEGIYHRDITNRNIGREQAFAHIKDTMPDAYRLMLHMEKGGSLHDFDRPSDLPGFEEIKDNLERQKQVYKQSIREKGITDEDDINTMLESAIKKDKLASSVENYLNTKNEEKTGSIQQIEQELEQQRLEEQQNYKILDSVLTEIYNTNTLPLIRIPDAQKSDAFDKFAESITYDKKSGAFLYMVPVTDDTIAGLIEADYIRNNPKRFKTPDSVNKEKKAMTIRDKNKKIETETKAVAVNKDKISLGQHF